jgi:hypothetical protein
MRTIGINSLSLVGLFTMSFVAPGLAQQAPPKPPAEMAQIAFFEGNWSCSGKMFESPMGPAGTMTSTAQIRRDLNGHFQTGLIKGTAANMPPFEGRFIATYDAGAKKYLMTWVDNMGGRSETSSSGWKGDTLVYEGDSHMGPQTIKTRETFTKSGAGSMKHVSEAEMNGRWMPVGEETCTKK